MGTHIYLPDFVVVVVVEHIETLLALAVLNTVFIHQRRNWGQAWRKGQQKSNKDCNGTNETGPHDSGKCTVLTLMTVRTMAAKGQNPSLCLFPWGL